MQTSNTHQESAMTTPDTSTPGQRPWGVPITSGTTAVLSMLPVDLLYGVAVMASLGAMASPLAIWSVFLPVALGNLFLARSAPGSALFGGLRAAQTVMVMALLAAVTRHPTLSAGGLPAALATLALAVSTSGCLMWLIGALKLGRVIKFIHLPVLVGITNGSAIALSWMALKDVLGIPALDAIGSLLVQADTRLGWRMVVLLALLILMDRASKRGWRLHWSLVGLLVGTALYQTVPLLWPTLAPYWSGLGGTLPAAPESNTHPHELMGLAALSSAQAWTDMLPLAMPVGLALATISSVDTLMSLAYLETLDGKRVEPNRVLRGLGTANIMGGLLGGLPVTPSNGRALIGYQAGARDWRSPLAGSGFALLLIVILPLGVGFIPRLVASAIMTYIAWTLIDQWSRRGVRKLLDSTTPPTLRGDLALMMFVTLMALVLGLIPAIALGLLVSTVLFVMNNSRSVIASLQLGNQRRSLVVRTPAEEQLLSPLRARIVLIELNGSLFFGTADAMRDDIEARLTPGNVLILSLRRIAAIDASGARALAAMARALKENQVEIFLSDVPALKPAARIQLMAALQDIVGSTRMPIDADRALQAAEDFLIEGDAHALGNAGAEISLAQSELLQDLSHDELGALERYFTRQNYLPNQTIFASGQDADALYLLTRGEVEISLRDEGHGAKRLGLFRPGVVFGEMGLLLAGKRSADALACSDVTLLALSAEALARLRCERPDLGFKLMQAIARHMASRLGIATAELRFALRN